MRVDVKNITPITLQLKEWKTSFILKSFSCLSCFYQDEFHSRLRFNRRGLVAMANAGPHDNGSQFFFTLGRADELNNKHTIFGKVCYTNWSPSLTVTEATRSFSEGRFNILCCYVNLFQCFLSVLFVSYIWWKCFCGFFLFLPILLLLFFLIVFSCCAAFK